MKKRILKGIIVTLLLCIMIAENVFAADAYSSWHYISCNDLGYDPAMVSYHYRAGLRTQTRYAQGIAQIYGDKQIPQSYVGALAKLYNSSGALVKSGNWNYNNSGPVTNHSALVAYNGTGTMYCEATFGVWANTREKIYTAKTTSVIVKSVDQLPLNKINKNGEVYGSGLSNNPVDLILVIGDNNVEGYVKATDLYGTPAKTREEFLRKTKQPAIKTIPVYDNDGTIIIDSFTMG